MEDHSDKSYPVNLNISYPENPSRLWALGTLLFAIPKMVVLIPHMLVLYVLGFVLFLLAVVSQIAVLFVGRYPKPLFSLIVLILQWQIRVNAFLFGLTDKYPPFG